MDGKAVPVVGRAQPQVVGGDGPQLADLQHRGDQRRKLGHRGQRRRGAGAGEQVLRLQLVAVAGGELHPEVREPFVPRPHRAHLLRAVVGGHAGHGVAGAVGHDAAQPVGRGRGGVGGALEPHGGLDGLGPVGEDAHAVARGEDVVDVGQQGRQWETLPDLLGDLEPRDCGEGEPGDHAEGPHRDDRPREAVRIGLAAELEQAAVGGHELQRDDRGGQHLVGAAGAVRPGRARPGHGDVRQRPHARQRQPGGVQRGGDVAVRQAPAHGDGACSGVDLEHPGQAVQAHQLAVGVGDRGEGVPRAEGTHPARPGHEALQLLDRRRPVHRGGGEGDVAGPVPRAYRGALHGSILAQRRAPDVPGVSVRGARPA